MYCGNGVRVLYQEREARCDVTQGYLRQEEGSLAVRVARVYWVGGWWVLARGDGAGLGWGFGRKTGGGQHFHLRMNARQGGPPRHGRGAGRARPGRRSECDGGSAW